jgi:hypothetical protein
MKRIAFLLLLLLAAIPLCADSYTGDLDPNHGDGLPNENDAIVGGIPYGAATYENVVETGVAWVIGFWTNDLMNITPQSGYWELRSGVSEGNGGTLIASGTATGSYFTSTPTGRSFAGYTEYKNHVDIGDYFIPLEPGTYWFSVVPQAPDQNGRSYNSNTLGKNGYGTFLADQQYWNSPSLGANFTNADNEGDFPLFSAGIEDGFIPESSTLMLFGSGLLGAGFAARRWIT